MIGVGLLMFVLAYFQILHLVIIYGTYLMLFIFVPLFLGTIIYEFFNFEKEKLDEML